MASRFSFLAAAASRTLASVAAAAMASRVVRPAGDEPGAPSFEVDAAIEFIKDKGVLSNSRDPIVTLELSYLRDPSSSPDPTYYKQCQKRLLRLHDAVKGHEVEAEQPPPDVHRFSLDEFPGYDSSSLLVTKAGVLVQRCQHSSLCYMHAGVVVQYYRIWHTLLCNGQTTSNHGVVDVGRHIGAHFDAKQLKAHVFDDSGGFSRAFLKSILPKDSVITTCKEEEYGEYLNTYGPALVSGFVVHTDFLDDSIHHHHGKPSGNDVGCHAMVLLGTRTNEHGERFYLLQNWWRGKQFVEVSASYLEKCEATVYFVKTPQAHVPEWLERHNAKFHWQEMEADMPEKFMA